MSAQKPVFNVSDWIKSQHCYGIGKKPIEIYIFIDPFCPKSWAMEPIIKKLHIEYGQLFSIRHVLSSKLSSLHNRKNKYSENEANTLEKITSRSAKSCDGSLLDTPISSPYSAYIAIKASELQSRKLSVRFIRKLREMLFLEKQDISQLDVLTKCALATGLDVEEFLKDITSSCAAKGFQCDLKITAEMEVNEFPTLVFFNENIEDAGIKVSGLYPYQVYVNILEEILVGLPSPSEPPAIEAFIRCFKFVATKEIEVVYNLTKTEAEKEMKKLVLKQLVEKVPRKYDTYWRYIDKEDPSIL